MYAQKDGAKTVKIPRTTFLSLLRQYAGKIHSWDTIYDIFVITTHKLPDGRELIQIEIIDR